MGDGTPEPQCSPSAGPGPSPSLNLATYPTPRLLRILASLLQQIASANDTIRADDAPALAEASERPAASAASTAAVEPREPASRLFPPSAAPPSPVSNGPTHLFSASAHSLSIPSSLLCFHARNVPSISIEAYLLRILKYCPTTNEVFLGLLVYFDRMSKIGHGKDKRQGQDANASAEEQRGFAIDSFNVHRLVIAGVTVASKFFSDVFYTNSRYAKVGGLPHNELNQLELQFLLLNDFRLVIPLEEMQRYGDQLLAYWDGKEEAGDGTKEAAQGPAESRRENRTEADTKTSAVNAETRTEHHEPEAEVEVRDEHREAESETHAQAQPREPAPNMPLPTPTPQRPTPTPSTSASNIAATRPPAPTPFHQLRSHQAPVSASAFNPSNTLLYTADADGFIAITDLKARRVVVHWKAHDGGVLGVEEWNGQLVSHGRDNKLLIHDAFELLDGPTANGPAPANAPPRIAKSLDTNALNFCRFSLCPLTREGEALLAVPNTVDSEVADIYHLPSMRRLHAGLNAKPDPSGTFRPNAENGDAPRTGLIMSLQLHLSPSSGSPRLAMGFEDGRVELWECSPGTRARIEEDDGAEWWERPSDARDPMYREEERRWWRCWEHKGHNEAVMAMTITPDFKYVFSVSADHLLCRYTLDLGDEDDQRLLTRETHSIGNGCLAVNSPGNVVAMGSWSGSIHLFSTASLKALGKLNHHRESCQTIAFAAAQGDEAPMETEEDDDEVEHRESWMASGGKDKRVALWSLADLR